MAENLDLQSVRRLTLAFLNSFDSPTCRGESGPSIVMGPYQMEATPEGFRLRRGGAVIPGHEVIRTSAKQEPSMEEIAQDLAVIELTHFAAPGASQG